MDKNDFYIGWQEKGPDSYFRRVRVWLLRAVAVIILFSFLWIKFQENLIDSRFEFGSLSEFEGRLVEYPAPMLLIEENGGESVAEAIPLVNFGKFGANQILNDLKNRLESGSLHDYTFRIRGTIFEYDSRRWLELTEEDKSILEFNPSEARDLEATASSWEGSASLTGEIVDPKCFFGVMNPAYGKIHLSCAVRCISGGIPPVLVAPAADGSLDYVFLNIDSSEDLNKLVLPYVGLPVRIAGDLGTIHGWNLLKINGAGSIELALEDNEIQGLIASSCVDRR